MASARNAAVPWVMSPRVAAAVVAALLGVALGVGGYTFVYAKGASYLTNDPRACANCHAMRDHFDAWVKSSHRAVAACNDCHTPHGPIEKYLTKASNGLFHSVAFTSGRFHDPLMIKSRSRAVTEQACRRCHRPMVDAMVSGHVKDDVSCVRCHAEVGHLR
jgi:cytochrome c nitrite reductase small subunit